MLILQNCLHVTKNKNILQQYRVNSFLRHEIENRAFKLRIHLKKRKKKKKRLKDKFIISKWDLVVTELNTTKKL